MITIGIFHWICLILPGLDHWFVPEKRIAWNRKTTVNWSPSWGCSYSRASHGGGDSAECLVEDVLVVVVVVMMLYITMPVVVPHAMMLIILGKWSRLFSLTPCSPWPPYYLHQNDLFSSLFPDNSWCPFHRNKLRAKKQHKGLSWELINYRRLWFGQFIREAKTLA